MFKRKRECKILKGMLSPYIDGQLSPSEMERIERHIEECDACRRELESLRAVVSLLHRVPMVALPRSFTIAVKAPRRHPAALGALRVATAVAVLLLAFVFTGDALNFIGPGPAEDKSLRQENAATYTPAGGEVLGAPDALDVQPETFNASESTWPVRSVELALIGVVVVLGGTTVILWQKRRRGEGLKTH
jgi:anti-sigma factor RsiW